MFGGAETFQCIPNILSNIRDSSYELWFHGNNQRLEIRLIVRHFLKESAVATYLAA